MASDELQVNEQAPDAAPSPGKILREERIKQGLSQQDMADKLFLRITNIVEIEEDRLDDNTSITFTKGYVRMYAKQLGINDKAVIAEFEKLHTAPKPPAKLQSFSRRVAKQAHDDRWMMVTYIILFLLVAGVVAWWYQQSGEESPVEDEGAGSPASVSVAQQGAAALQENQKIENAAPPNPIAVRRVSEEASIATDEADPVPAPSADEPESVDEQETFAEESPQAEAVATMNPEMTEDEVTPTEVTFTFGTDCWVNVEDATGEAIAYGVKQAGRVMTIQGLPPFEVTLGAPDNVTISYAGEPVDMSSYQNGRTARFTLPIQG